MQAIGSYLRRKHAVFRLNWHEWIATALDWPRQRRARKPGETDGQTPMTGGCWGERLEERWLLATFTDSAPSLNLVLGTNQSLAIVSTGSTYSLRWPRAPGAAPTTPT